MRSDLAIKIFGDDLDVLRRKADEVVAAVSRIPGASGFKAQQVTGLPVLQIVVDPDRMARYGINAADVMTVVETLGGAEATQAVGRYDEKGDTLDGQGSGRVRRVAEQCNLAEQISLGENPKNPLPIRRSSPNLDLPVVHEVGLPPSGIPLAEDHLSWP